MSTNQKNEPRRKKETNGNRASETGIESFLHAIGFCLFTGGLCLSLIVGIGIVLSFTDPGIHGDTPPSVAGTVTVCVVALSACTGGLLLMLRRRIAGGTLTAVSVGTAMVAVLRFLLNTNFRGP